MRKIIYVWNYRDWGGAQVYFMSLMKEAKKSYAVTALIPSDSERKLLQYLDALEIPVEYLPPSLLIGKPNSIVNKIKLRLAVLRSENILVKNLIKREDLRETIVHVDLGFWQSFFTLFRLARKTNIFMTVHTALPQYNEWRYLRWAVKGTILTSLGNVHLLASNRDAKESLKPYIRADKFDVVEVTYSGVDPDEIKLVTENLPSNKEIRQRYDLPDDKQILMTVGQFIERKGCWVLLESLKKIKEDFICVWLTTTLPDADTTHKVAAYGLEDKFRLIGANEIGETRADMLTLLSAADIFVLASLQEGLPIALIEAMALGLPCVATNVNAIPEAVEHGQNGLLVPPNDPSKLREAMLSLLNDLKLRETLGQAAKQTAFKKFDSQISATRTVELYDDAWKTYR